MNRNVLLFCLFGLIGFAACASPPPDQLSPTVEAPTATVVPATLTSTATIQPTPTATITPTITPTPVVAPDYVWLDSDGLMIYSRDGNLCMKDGDADSVYLMPADSCGYDPRLFNDAQTIVLLSKEAYPAYGCDSVSFGTKIWRVDLQTGKATYLTSTFDIAEELDAGRLYPIWSFQQVLGLNAFVFNTAEGSNSVTYGKDLYRVDENGQLTVLVEPDDGAISFVLSPDGQHIVYLSRDDEIYPHSPYWIGMIDTNGENWRPRLITYDPINTEGTDRIVTTHPIWRSDSAGFWIAIPPPNRWSEDIPNIMTTWYVPVDGEPVQLGSFEQFTGIINDATFSPDGKYVAYAWEFTALNGLHIIRPDGSGDILYFEGSEYDQYDFIRWEDNTHFII